MGNGDQNQDRAKRIAHRYLREAMAVVLRGVPGSVDWGFYTREDPRMHLQTVDPEHRNKYKVWLEKGGRRVFEPEGHIPKKILTALYKKVRDNRGVVEGRWVGLMISKGWLTLDYDGKTGTATLTVYPSHRPTKKVVDVAKELPADWPRDPSEVGLNPEQATLAIWTSRHESQQPEFDLVEILWTGRR